MKKNFLLCLFLSLSSSAFSQMLPVVWAQSAGSTGYETAYSMATDAQHNLYVSGIYSSASITFGEYTLINENPGTDNTYLVKYNPDGQALWAVQSTGNSYEIAYELTVDKDGNAYLVGRFEGTAAFGDVTLTHQGAYDLFIVKYDTNGNKLWAKGAGTLAYEEATDVVTDADGNVYLTGYFAGTSITFGSSTLTGTENINKFFLIKFDEDGNVLWTRHTLSEESSGAALSIDGNGDLYILGNFSTALTFASAALTGAGDSDVFLAKYNTDGIELWAKSFGSADREVPYDLGSDSEGNAYLTGTFDGASLTVGTTTLSNAQAEWQDVFLIKYNAAGNWQWSQAFGGTGSDICYSLYTNPDGSTFLAGHYEDSDLQFAHQTLGSKGYYDVFLAKYSADGEPLKVTTGGGSGYDYAQAITGDASGNLYAAGSFVDYNVTFDETTLINKGNEDVFIVKLQDGLLTPVVAVQDEKVKAFPNPCNGNFNITGLEGEGWNIRVYAQTGSLLYESSLTETNAIDLQAQPKGMYLYQLQNGDQLKTGKIMIE